MYNKFKLFLCICCRYKIKPHISHFIMLLYFTTSTPPQTFFSLQFTYRTLHTYSYSRFYPISFTEKLKASTITLFSLRFLISRIQLACKFNQIIQLRFTLQKLRYKSTLVKLRTTEAVDKPFTKTNGKTLWAHVCSSTVKFLLNLIPPILTFCPLFKGLHTNQ